MYIVILLNSYINVNKCCYIIFIYYNIITSYIIALNIRF